MEIKALFSTSLEWLIQFFQSALIYINSLGGDITQSQALISIANL